MDYISFSAKLRKNRLYLFTLQDIKNLFPKESEKTIKNNLTRWSSKKYCIRLRKNLYEFIEEGREVAIPDIYAANRLYSPSYVSLETALSIYSIKPDIASAVTSVTSRCTRTFKSKYGVFLYHTCKRKAFVGYKLMVYDGFKVYIADREKALVDFLYYRLRKGKRFLLDFDEERLNKKILKEIDWKKAEQYAKLYNPKTSEKLKECEEYVKC